MKLNRNDFEQEKAVFSIEQKENFSKIAKICHALSSEIRLEIIRQLQYEPMTLPELAKKNFLSTTAAVYHMECLYESGLIDIVYEPTSHGKIRVCHRMLNDFYINLRLIENEKEKGSLRRQRAFKIFYTRNTANSLGTCGKSFAI